MVDTKRPYSQGWFSSGIARSASTMRMPPGFHRSCPPWPRAVIVTDGERRHALADQLTPISIEVAAIADVRLESGPNSHPTGLVGHTVTAAHDRRRHGRLSRSGSVLGEARADGSTSSGGRRACRGSVDWMIPGVTARHSDSGLACAPAWSGRCLSWWRDFTPSLRNALRK
jgi:hypothetical protein